MWTRPTVCALVQSAFVQTGFNLSPWTLMAAKLHGVSSHTGSIKTIRNDISAHSGDASARRTALVMHIFRIGDARVGSAEEKGIYNSSKGFAFRKD